MKTWKQGNGAVRAAETSSQEGYWPAGVVPVSYRQWT